MMNIRLITVGKLKESYWRDSEKEYLKRLSPYAKIDIVEMKEEAFSSENERETIQKKEAEKVFSKIDATDTVIALHERGQEMTSIDFSKVLEEKSQQGMLLTFIIGGPLGLHASLLERAQVQLSLSQLTFPHQMVRTILLEQLYRSVMIGKGKYHY